MKIYFKIACCLMFIPAMVSGAPARDGGMTFRDVEEKEWILSEFRHAGVTIRMDRQKLQADGLGEIYMISFKETSIREVGNEASNGGQVSGMGAPNRYFGPYTVGSNRTLSIGNLASTMMAAFREPDDLKEREYFGYLSNVTRWDLNGESLELYSSDSAGAEVILIFGVK